MSETKCFRDAFRDQLHELSGQPNSFEKWDPFKIYEWSIQDLKNGFLSKDFFDLSSDKHLPSSCTQAENFHNSYIVSYFLRIL